MKEEEVVVEEELLELEKKGVEDEEAEKGEVVVENMNVEVEEEGMDVVGHLKGAYLQSCF